MKVSTIRNINLIIISVMFIVGLISKEYSLATMGLVFVICCNLIIFRSNL